MRVGGEPDHEEIPAIVTLTASATEIAAGEPVNLTAKVVGDYGMVIEADVEFEISNDTSASTIEAGVLTTADKGEVTITAKSGDIASEPIVIRTIAKGTDIADIAKGATVVIDGDDTIDGSTLIDANDGSMFIFADGGENEQEHSAIIDLHRFADVDLVRIHMEGASSSAYTLAFSADGESYTDVYSFTGKDEINGYTHNHYGEDVTKVRYIKFISTRNGTGYGLKVFEISVFGELYLQADADGNFSGNWNAEDFSAQVNKDTDVIDLTAVEGLPDTKPEAENASPNLLMIVTPETAFASASNVLTRDSEGNLNAAVIDLYNTADYSNQLAFTADKVFVHTEVVKENIYTEGYLPFAYKAAEGKMLYQFDGILDDAVYLTEGVSEIPANTPFVIEIGENNFAGFEAENVTFEPMIEMPGQVAAPEFTKVAMSGTYSKCKPESQDGYIVKEGELRAILSDDYILPFGAYTSIPGITRDYIIKPFDHSTSINNIDIATDKEIVDVYTTSGLKIKSGVNTNDAMKGLQPGIYLIGGRRVLIAR